MPGLCFHHPNAHYNVLAVKEFHVNGQLIHLIANYRSVRGNNGGLFIANGLRVLIFGTRTLSSFERFVEGLLRN